MENKEIDVIGNKTESVTKDSEITQKKPIRQIIIETDGDKINLIKAESAGKIELIAIFQTLIGYLNSQK